MASPLEDYFSNLLNGVSLASVKIIDDNIQSLPESHCKSLQRNLSGRSLISCSSDSSEEDEEIYPRLPLNNQQSRWGTPEPNSLALLKPAKPQRQSSIELPTQDELQAFINAKTNLNSSTCCPPKPPRRLTSDEFECQSSLKCPERPSPCILRSRSDSSSSLSPERGSLLLWDNIVPIKSS